MLVGFDLVFFFFLGWVSDSLTPSVFLLLGVFLQLYFWTTKFLEFNWVKDLGKKGCLTWVSILLFFEAIMAYGIRALTATPPCNCTKFCLLH